MGRLGTRNNVTISLLSLGVAIAFYVFSATIILTRSYPQCSCPKADGPMLELSEEQLRALLNLSLFSVDSDHSNRSGSLSSVVSSLSSEVTHAPTKPPSKVSPVPKTSMQQSTTQPPPRTKKPTPKLVQTPASKPSAPPKESPVKPPPPVKNPSSCSSLPQYLAIYVHSGPGNVLRRHLIRQTWGSPDVLKRINATLNFILGKPEQQSLDEALARENKSYGDLIQGHFRDTYRNISLKALTGLKWVSQHCQHARYLLKSDDDIFVDVFALVRHLMSSVDSQSGTAKGMLLCNYWDNRVHRTPLRKKSKWVVTYAEYNKTQFPGFCQGAAYVLTPDVAMALHQKSLTVPRLWLDDVYVTGLLREAANVTATQLNRFFKEGRKIKFADLIKQTASGSPLFVHHLELQLFKDLWMHVIKMERVHQLKFQV